MNLILWYLPEALISTFCLFLCLDLMANLPYVSLMLLFYSFSYVTSKWLMKTVTAKGVRAFLLRTSLDLHFAGCEQGYFLHSSSDSSYLLCQRNCKFELSIRFCDTFGHNPAISVPISFHSPFAWVPYRSLNGREKQIFFFFNVFLINLPLLSFAFVSVWEKLKSF